MSKHTATTQHDYDTILVSLIDESKTNPRRTFDPAKLQELSDNIAKCGLIQPIVVRPKNDRYEIVVGTRRFRGTCLAGKDSIRAIIRNLSDDQALEMQIIENSQREDVHPYEEANGYKTLLDRPGYDVAALASSCGKSGSHIYARLSLLQLIPGVAEAFQENRITASHANLIARLTPEQQPEAFSECFSGEPSHADSILRPARHLASWIKSNLYLSLAEAPFSTEDESLVPEAGSCLNCPKHSGYNTQLFADLQGNQCLDSPCYHGKVSAFLNRQLTENPKLVQISTTFHREAPDTELQPYQYRDVHGDVAKIGKDVGEDDDTETQTTEALTTPVKVKKCAHMKDALITYGRGTGQIVSICTDRDCEVHSPRAQAPSAEVVREQEARQQERERQLKERTKRKKRLTALLSRIPATPNPEQIRILLNSLILGDFDLSCEYMALRIEGDESNDCSSEEVCARALADAPASSVFTFLAELALGSHSDIPRPEEVDCLVRAEIAFPAIPATKAKPTASAKPTKKAAAAKPAKAKAGAKKSAKAA